MLVLLILNKFSKEFRKQYKNVSVKEKPICFFFFFECNQSSFTYIKNNIYIENSSMIFNV